MKPKEIILEFDQYLTCRKLQFNAVVIGGAALSILGVIARETQDCDVLDPEIPKDIEQAAKDFSRAYNNSGSSLRENWLNNGPVALKQILPSGWRFRLEVLYQGAALSLYTLGRSDLLKTKLFAYCDRGQDFGDCVAMQPLQEELSDALPWLKVQDTNPQWPAHVDSMISKLATRLGYGV